jgi:hypothetical protein
MVPSIDIFGSICKVIMKRLLHLFFIMFPLLLVGCQVQSLTADTLPWVGEEKVLFRDDFSFETGGWRTYQDSLSFAGYQAGGFRLLANVPYYQFWSVPGLNLRNAIIYTNASKLDGPDDNMFGILCRYQDPANYYALVIGSDGYYGIFKMVAGQQALIAQAHMDFSEVINRGESTNELTALCQDDTLALIVNEIPLIQVEDADLDFGDVGLVVGNFSEPGVDILFDDFIVVKP